MTTVTRSQFVSSFSSGVDVKRSGAAADVAAKADKDADGVVKDAELETLFDLVDDFDTNGFRNSVSDSKPLALIGAMKAPGTPPPMTPTAPTAPTAPAPTTTALEAAQKAVAAAEANGLSGFELAQAQDGIARTYGPAVAKSVMQNALGLKLDKLDKTGVDWVQRHLSTGDAAITRYQQALTTHLKDAKLIDANFDGKLDAGDKLWTADASGKVNIANIEPALLDRVKIGGAFVGAAEAMDTAAHSFALIKDHTFNADYWSPIGGGSFKLKPGVTPSDAFDDIFKNPSKYKFECATGLVITQYKAMRDLLGKEDFDRACAKLRVGPWVNEQTLEDTVIISGSGSRDATPDRKSTLRAGDYGYFNNWDVSDKGRDEGWQGENVIYLGDGKFYGHPFGIADEKTIVDYLNTQRKEGSTRSASYLDLRSSFSSQILREDRKIGD